MVAFLANVTGKQTVKIKDQAAHFVQPDLDLHWPQIQLKEWKVLHFKPDVNYQKNPITKIGNHQKIFMPHIDRLGAYCFTDVCLSVCLYVC